MNIIVPMAGSGERFTNAGYANIKPLIMVQGRPIIEWVINMFPGEHNFTFICRRDHLLDTDLQATLKRIKPACKIIPIESHKKGPVYSIVSSIENIDDQEPCLVSYCDYYMLWDFQGFRECIERNDLDALVPCYTGFHPHLIPQDNVYASCRVDKNNVLLEIREKHSFAKEKYTGHYSPGLYYFRSGKMLREYGQQLLDEGLTVNGEFYVSMLYQLMLREHRKILVYDRISHFCQWGTPYDLEKFNFWINTLGRSQ